jgi:hypothetical protein
MDKNHIAIVSSIGAAILFVALLTWIGYLIVGNEADRPVPKFENGTLVQSVLNKQRGMIIRSRCLRDQMSCYYDVRFSGFEQKTNTHLFRRDGAVTQEPLMTVEYMREYELEAIEDK